MLFLTLFIVIIISIVTNTSSTGNILIAPKLTPILNSRTQDENSMFSMVCSVQKGSQPMFFEWHRNGQSLKSVPDVNYKIDFSDMFTMLTIKSISASDAANYTCIVKNGLGSDMQSVILTVKGKIP